MDDGTNNLWNTPETHAWSRDFNYDEYCEMHTLNNIEAVKLTQVGYSIFCQMCEHEMEADPL